MKIVKRGFLIVAVVVASGYGTDYLVARKRPLGSVVVQPYFAVPQKNGKTEFMMQDAETDSCVQSLFPHMDQMPCWYLEKHKNKRIDF